MKVLIGIQARSGSTRLPRKAFELISGRTMLDRVIDNCRIAADYIRGQNRHQVTVAVLTPTGDPIVEEFQKRVEVIQGPEFDVLARYKVAVDQMAPDMVVRVTGDCPLLPPPSISYLTNMAIDRGYDYLSNSDDRCRTSIDGSDCEVFSRRIFDVAAEHASAPYDREHVTPFMRRSPPEWAKLGMAMHHFDLSSAKLSVDTKEDLERVRKAFDAYFQKRHEAIRLYGKGNIHHL